MNVPALAANPPAGATQTMIGIFASSSVPTMSLVDVSAPPGVLSLITTAAAPRCSATSMLSARYLAMPSSTTPVVGRRKTSGPAARAPAASSSQPLAINASDSRSRPRRPLGRPPVDMVVTTSTLSIAPLRRRTLGDHDAVSGASGGHSLEMAEGERAPGFHVTDDAGHVPGFGEGAAELVGLTDRHGPAPRIGYVDRADVHAAHVGRVVVDEPDQLELGLEVRLDLLAPLAAQSAGEVAVTGVQVTADPDRPQVVQARVAAGLRPAHQEVARAVTEHEVRDHLLPRPVAFHLAPATELPVLCHEGFERRAGQVATDAVPARVRHQDLPRDHQDDLVVTHCGGSASALRAASRRSRSASGLGCPSRARSQSSMASRKALRRAATAALFVARIPAPMSGSPRASRVMSLQP